MRKLLQERLEVAGISLQPDAVEQLATYFALLARWNARMNLAGFSLDSPTAPAIDRLIVEPAAAAPQLPEHSLRWLDIGSGGGSPAIPLKILRPAAALVMVEVKGRKAAFLREAVRTLALVDTVVLQQRFEDVSNAGALAHKIDWITIRAVRADRDVFDAASRLLTDSGRIMAFAGESDTVEAADGFALAIDQPMPLALGGRVRIWRHVPQ